MRALAFGFVAVVAFTACVGTPTATTPTTFPDVTVAGTPADGTPAAADGADSDADLAEPRADADSQTEAGPELSPVAEASGADSKTADTGVDAGKADGSFGVDGQLDTGVADDAQTDTTGADVSADAKADADVGLPEPPTLAVSVTQPMWLTNGAFAKNTTWPSAIAFAPTGLQPAGPLHVIVYLHGHYNCATNVLGDTDTACKVGGSKRPASKLASQLSATGVKALLLVPEVKVDEGSSDPGTFGKAGGFQAFLAEALSALQPPLVPRKIADVQMLAIASHSGGYLAAASIATQGGVNVDQLWLLDSLYGAYPSFVAWAKQDLPGFGKAGPDWKRRLFVVYTDGGGTVTLSKQLAAEAKGWGPAAAWVHDTTTATWADMDYGHGLLFKHSGLSHHGVTMYYFGKLVGTGPGL